MSILLLPFTSNPFATLDGIDSTIHNVYHACFEAIQSDTQTHIAMYMWHDEGKPAGVNNPKTLTDTLLSSVKRTGASTRVLFDIDYLAKGDVTALKQRFSDSGIDAIFPAFKKPNKRIAARPKMHHKMMLFSRLRFPPDSHLTALAGKTVENVVIQSSANMWSNQYQQANQLIMYYNDGEFYRYNLRVWESLCADLKNPELTSFSNITPAAFDSGAVTAYSLPRRDNVVIGILNNILHTPQSHPPVIRIAIGHFSNTNIAKKLVHITKMYEHSVRIVGRNGDVSASVLNILEPSVDIHLPEGSSGGNIIHSKFMLVDADYLITNVKRRRLAWAGSLNYTSAALTRNSETLVRMADDGVYEHLLDAWTQLWDARHKPPHPVDRP